MNVMQRPLFRQAGGPVAPNMAAQDPRLAVRGIEAQAAQEAMPVGQMLAQETMANIDAAETPEQIINALRGNDRPMEDRYAELASFVGEADAQRTPESVLALVQPTLMMTEEGALDSGIGELLRTMTGDVEMETPDGAPTAMGQGVGSLLMAGAPSQETGVGQPPVANFNQGGAVQRFQEGGEASRLQQLYGEMLPVYQGVLGDTGEARRMGQAQVLFDIADRAAAFAAGVDPRTGQSVARLSPAAQLGVAVSGLGGQIGERVAGMEEQDRALRLAALQAAQGEYSAERAAARAAAASGRDRAIGNPYEAVDAEGNVIATEFLATRSDLEAFRAANPDATIRAAVAPETDFGTVTLYAPDGTPATVVTTTAEGRARAAELVARGYTDVAPAEAGFDTTTLYAPDGTPVTINRETAEGRARANALLAEGYTDVAPEAAGFATTTLYSPDGTPVTINTETVEGRARAAQLLGEGYTDVAPSTAEAPFINIQTADGNVVSVRENSPEATDLIRDGGTVVSRTGPVRADSLVDPEVMGRYATGETSPEETAAIQDEIAQRSRPVFNPDTGEYERPTVTPLILNAEQARRDAGLPTVLTLAEPGAPSPEGDERLSQLEEFGGAAFGSGAFFRNIGNVAFSPTGAVPAPQTQDAVNAVNALNQDALIAFRELTAGRPAQDAINQFQALLPNPAEFFGSPRGAASQVQQLINLYNANIAAARDAAASGTASATQRQQLEQAIISSQRMVAAYTALRNGILGGTTGGGGVDPSQFRR